MTGDRNASLLAAADAVMDSEAASYSVPDDWRELPAFVDLRDAIYDALASLSASGAAWRPKVKALTWRKPADHPQDMEDALWIANGVGGHYSISKQQSLSSGSPGHLLWWPDDEFAFDEFRNVEAAMAAAQADYEARILSALDVPEPVTEVVDA
jgi:hypothetical protein